MKITITAIVAALFMSAGFVVAATNDITGLLQKGLFEEEANHNLEAAMRQYQAAIDGFDTDRQLAATAVFRLGECLRKAGKANEANIQYERILRDFADQATLAGLCREYLAGKTPPVISVGGAAATATSAEDEEVRKIREMIRSSPDLINGPGEGMDTPLQQSVFQGNIAAAELLLANGADINGTGGYNRTPLSIAADHGNKAMIELLLAKGADVNAADKDNLKQTPLDQAVAHGFKTAAEVLIAHKADVNARRSDGATPLHAAARAGFKAMAEMLIAHGAEVNAADKNGNTPLLSAVQKNEAELVELLLASKADVNCTNSVGETPLFMATRDDQIKTAQLLLANKANVNARDKSGYTPLHWAVFNNQAVLVKLFLSNKADVNATTDTGITPLLFAVARSGVNKQGQNGSGPDNSSPLGSAATDLVKILLENGADTQAHIKDGGGSWGPIVPGIHALDLAVRYGMTDEMELLLAGHADPNARFATSQYSSTPLLRVLTSWRYNPTTIAEGLKFLLDHGADPDLTDQEGKTPLSIAAGHGDLKSVQQLLDHHADPNKPDNQGLPPLAYVGDKVEIRAALLKAGANEDFQRQARIFIAQKGTGSIGREIFRKGTNSVNHFTLLEVMAEACKNGRSPIEFPDLAHVVINRLKAGGGKEDIAVNLEDILSSGDSSKDVPLEWGDVVQIPQLDHLLNESQQGLPEKLQDALRKLLQRHVQIVVKGQTTKLTLVPPIDLFRRSLAGSPGASIAKEVPVEKTIQSFSLDEVVHQANVLLLSSDLTRVKVTRSGQEMQYNLAPPAPGDLWLRDGDLIEIPERDPNTPAMK